MVRFSPSPEPGPRGSRRHHKPDLATPTPHCAHRKRKRCSPGLCTWGKGGARSCHPRLRLWLLPATVHAQAQRRHLALTSLPQLRSSLPGQQGRPRAQVKRRERQSTREPEALAVFSALLLAVASPRKRVFISVESALRSEQRACAREPRWLLSTPAREGLGGGSQRPRTQARQRLAPAPLGAAETVGSFASPRLARRWIRSLRRRRGRHRARRARGEARALETWEGGPGVGRPLGGPGASALLGPGSRVHSFRSSQQSAGRAGRNGE